MGSMNQALFVLTVATAVFLPAQFLAGVYGMNFSSGMRMLDWEYGYYVFWILSGSFVLGGMMTALTYTRNRCRCCFNCCRRDRTSDSSAGRGKRSTVGPWHE